MKNKLRVLVKNYSISNFILLAIHLLLLLITQFTAWPEMLIYPYLMSQGFHFYGDIIQPYMPLLPVVLNGVFSFLGYSIFSLQLVSIGSIIIIDVFIIAIQRKHFSAIPLIFILLPFVLLQLFFEGNGIWFDQAAIPFILGAYYLLLEKQKKNWHYYVAAFCIGLAIITKQTSFWFIIPLSYKIIIDKQLKLLPITLCLLLTPVLTLFLFFKANDILFWTLYYPFTQMSRTPGYIIYPTLRQLGTTLIVFSPLLLLFLQPKLLKGNINTALMFLASLGYVIPRFAFFHFQPAIVFFSFLLGLIIFNRKVVKISKWFFAVYVIIILILFGKYAKQTAFRPVRFFEPEVFSITQELHKVIPTTEPVFFYNDMGNQLFLGKFLPAKPWTYTFPWYMEIPGLQEKIVQGLKQQNVMWVVFKPFGSENRYTPGSYVPETIQAYIDQYYSSYQEIGELRILKRNP